jgi:hypothetical protein
MELLILGSVLAGFSLLLAGTIGLVVLNRSKEALALLGLVVAVGLALATLLLSLRGSTLAPAFPTSVVLDTVDGAPPLVMRDASDFKIMQKFSEFYHLTRPLARGSDAAVWEQGETIAIPDGYDEKRAFAFCGELLQYQILAMMLKLQAGGHMVGMAGGTAISEVYTPFHLSKIYKYPGKELLPTIVQNRFANNDGQRALWEAARLPLPPNTTLELLHEPALQTGGADRFIIRMEKPLFFRIELIIQQLGTRSRGVLPPGFKLNAPIAARCQTFDFRVEMQALFRWVTAGNWETQEYREWANWLFGRLQENLVT